MARSDQLAGPGDYISCDLFDNNIIVVRDKTGTINAFSNTCIHRASTIVSGSGHCNNLLVCPYHKWTYELNGKLRGAPNMDQAIAFDRSDMQLPLVRVEQWQGWVFVNADVDAAPLAPGLTELSALFDQWNVEGLKHVGTLHYESRWQMTIKSHEYFDLDIQVMLPEAMANDEETVQSALASLDEIHREDIPACEGVWKGLYNPLYTAGRLSHLEACLWDFYRYLQSAMQD